MRDINRIDFRANEWLLNAIASRDVLVVDYAAGRPNQHPRNLVARRDLIRYYQLLESIKFPFSADQLAQIASANNHPMVPELIGIQDTRLQAPDGLDFSRMGPAEKLALIDLLERSRLHACS